MDALCEQDAVVEFGVARDRRDPVDGLLHISGHQNPWNLGVEPGEPTEVLPETPASPPSPVPGSIGSMFAHRPPGHHSAGSVVSSLTTGTVARLVSGSYLSPVRSPMPTWLAIIEGIVSQSG